MKNLLFSSFAALIWAVAPQVQAVPIASESFDGSGYTNGAALNGLNGLNGGTGWAGAWTGSAGDTISTTGMTYEGGTTALSAPGGKLQSIGGGGGRVIATGAGSQAAVAGLVDANGNIGADGKSVWVAFVAQFPASGADFGISFDRPVEDVGLPQTGIMDVGSGRQ